MAEAEAAALAAASSKKLCTTLARWLYNASIGPAPIAGMGRASMSWVSSSHQVTLQSCQNEMLNDDKW